VTLLQSEQTTVLVAIILSVAVVVRVLIMFQETTLSAHVATLSYSVVVGTTYMFAALLPPTRDIVSSTRLGAAYLAGLALAGLVIVAHLFVAVPQALSSVISNARAGDIQTVSLMACGGAASFGASAFQLWRQDLKRPAQQLEKHYIRTALVPILCTLLIPCLAEGAVWRGIEYAVMGLAPVCGCVLSQAALLESLTRNYEKCPVGGNLSLAGIGVIAMTAWAVGMCSLFMSWLATEWWLYFYLVILAHLVILALLGN
jgi:hypothetical protein